VKTAIQKYLKTDVDYVIKNGLWLTISHIIGVTASIALAIAFANLVPASVYGQYSFIMSVTVIIGAFSLTGLQTAVTKVVAQGYGGSLKRAVLQSFKWSSGVVIMSLGMSIYYLAKENEILFWSFLISAVCIPITASFSLYKNYLDGIKKFKDTAFLFSLEKIIITTVLIFVLFYSKNIILIVLAFFLTGSIFAFIFYLYTVRVYTPNSKEAADLLNFSKHLSAMNILKIVSGQIDKVLMFQFLGATQLAIYAFAKAPITELGMSNRIIANLALPKLSEQTYAEIKASLPRKVLLLTLLMIVIVSFYIYFSSVLFKVVFPQYLSAIIYSQIYSLTLIFSPTILFNKALVVHKKLKPLYIIKITIPILKVGLMVLFIPIYGMWGAIGSLLFCDFVKMIMLTFSFYQQK